MENFRAKTTTTEHEAIQMPTDELIRNKYSCSVLESTLHTYLTLLGLNVQLLTTAYEAEPRF